MPTKSITYRLWDTWCIASIIGIWPRFIEPNLLKTTKVKLKIKQLPKKLKNLKVVQFSDLHLNDSLSNNYLKKVSSQINDQDPDLVLFTGDFICYSKLSDPDRLKEFLNSIKARYGAFAILGNHDYTDYLSINHDGEYDIITDDSTTLFKGFLRLCKKTELKKSVTEKARSTPLNPALVELIKDTKFKLLHNETFQVKINDEKLNICGLGEYMSGRFSPDEAFKNYNEKYPGIILLHNPDGSKHLKKYPGDLILCGHTHGSQINLPWFKTKCTLLEDMEYTRGLFKKDNKWIYVNRGIGSPMPFRWFSTPEITVFTLN